MTDQNPYREEGEQAEPTDGSCESCRHSEPEMSLAYWKCKARVVHEDPKDPNPGHRFIRIGGIIPAQELKLKTIWCEDVRKEHGEVCPMHSDSPSPSISTPSPEPEPEPEPVARSWWRHPMSLVDWVFFAAIAATMSTCAITYPY